MKQITLVILIATISMIITKENKANQFSLQGPFPEPPASYANLPSSNAILQQAAGFVSPTYMDKIPSHLNSPYSGQIETATGYVGQKVYYNGSDNLNVIHVECGVYTTTPQGCVHNKDCGWCGEKSACIPGNLNGPLAPCLRNTFLFTAPSDDWNPTKAGTLNIHAVDEKGVPQFHVTHTPDLSNVDVHNPYK